MKWQFKLWSVIITMFLKKCRISDTFNNRFNIVLSCIDSRETILRINNISQLINQTKTRKIGVSQTFGNDSLKFFRHSSQNLIRLWIYWTSPFCITCFSWISDSDYHKINSEILKVSMREIFSMLHRILLICFFSSELWCLQQGEDPRDQWTKSVTLWMMWDRVKVNTVPDLLFFFYVLTKGFPHPM